MEIIAQLVKNPLIAVLVSILLVLVYLWLKRTLVRTFKVQVLASRPFGGNYIHVHLRKHCGGFRRGSWVWAAMTDITFLRDNEVI